MVIIRLTLKLLLKELILILIKVFLGQVFLSRNRTEQKISSGLKLGTILFGGNHTNASKSNIAKFVPSMFGMSSGDFNSVTDMPTDLVFHWFNW